MNTEIVAAFIDAPVAVAAALAHLIAVVYLVRTLTATRKRQLSSGEFYAGVALAVVNAVMVPVWISNLLNVI